ncbi:DUF4435 domain-containing protein [Bacillus alveayuensis]|uniref:DUF4435 domain-containing protein n=1 Tax=Aeribacillus alveayuensis TaxID=279215 RepID=UPI0005CCE0A6|nr:DUF4435 domain-containing protein [Bacillus alveayuensis]
MSFQDSYDSLTYSIDGEFNLSLFLSSYNDLMIYVEDKDRPNIYESLFKRLLGNEIKIENIHLSGGKERVKELYKKYKENPITPCFFIVDLDFDDLHEKEKVSDENFLYLDRYSIENYLVDEHVGGVFLNGRLQIGEEKCREIIKFKEWLNEISQGYKYLICIFLCIQSLELPIENTSEDAGRFIKDKSWELDSEKIQKYYEKALSLALQKGKYEEFLDLMEFYDKKIQSLYHNEIWRVIPGKQLIKIFWRYLVGFCSYKTVYEDDFYHLAARECSLENLFFVKKAIMDYLKKFVA